MLLYIYVYIYAVLLNIYVAPSFSYVHLAQLYIYSGALVESMPIDQRAVGSNPALHEHEYEHHLLL